MKKRTNDRYKKSNEIRFDLAKKLAESKENGISEIQYRYNDSKQSQHRTKQNNGGRSNIFLSLWHRYLHIPAKERLIHTSMSVVILFLVIFAVVQSVRISKVKKELRSVKAMAEGTLLSEKNPKVDETTDQGNGTGIQQNNLIPTKQGTPTPLPTKGPTPTPTPAPFCVCVDAGHGDWDGGATLKENGEEIQVEKTDNLFMAKLFRDELETYGVKVIMTREEDVYLELEERTDIANKADADLLISFHRNSFAADGVTDPDTVNGVEIWLHNSQPENATRLAESMLSALSGIGITRNRGVKYGTMKSSDKNYEINKSAKMTSMIVELGFVNSSQDNKNLEEKGTAYAKGLANVVYEWLLKEREAANGEEAEITDSSEITGTGLILESN